MRWFNKKKSETKLSARDQSAIVEIEATKDAQKEAFAEADRVGKDLNRLLVENGFTLKIYLATGGHPKTKKGTTK